MSSNSCSFDAEASFGPSVDPCRRPFDFTLLFEGAIFQLLPSCIFIIAGLIRLIAFRKRPSKVEWGPLHTLKLTVLAIFSALELAILICICAKDKSGRTSVSIPAAVLSFLASLQLALVSHFEHVRTYRPSFLIAVYLPITLLLRIVTVRTYQFIDGAKSPTFAITLTAVLVQTAIIVLESCSKRKWFLPHGRHVSPEESAGLWSRGAFTWLNRLLVTGSRRQLQSDDLRIVDSALESWLVADEFSRLHMSKDYGPFGLIGATFQCLGLYALSPVIPRLCVTGFTFCQPFLASSLISYLENPNAPKNTGYGLIGASVLIYGGMAISQAFYMQLCWKCAAKIRGGLVETINAKMLRLKFEKGVESKVLTLIISDAWRMVVGMAFTHDLWAAIIETAIGTWLLWRQVGPSSLAVLGVATVALVLAVFVGGSIGGQQSGWLAATEKRLEATKTLLSSLKAVKMMSSGQRVKLAIEKLRLLEFGASRFYRILVVVTVLCSFTPMTLAPVAVFGAYIGHSGSMSQQNENIFDTSKMFSSLILIALVANPLIHVFQIIPNLGAAVGCAKRVEEFLKREELVDNRSDLVRNIHSDNSTPVAETKDSSPLILSIQDADIAWDDKDLLKNVNLQVAKGQHIAITGPVGSGKSLLLQAMLGEVAPKSGSIQVPPGVSVGYCTQTAWLENLSVRDNAFRDAPKDPAWRERVIDACALRELLSSEVSGSTIGSGGSKISGGEKQRLSLARAIASRPSLLLLDDVFSAIDRSTKQVIFGRLFGPKGIVTELGITVVQVVQDRHVAEMADAVYKIDEEGRLVAYQFPSSDGGDGNITSSSNDSDKGSTDQISTQNQEGKSKEGVGHSTREKKEHADPASIGDRQVYKVYYNSIGPVHASILALGMMAFAVTLKFPDIWVKWWTFDANLEHPTKSTGYWIGLYALLGALPLITGGVALGHLSLEIIPLSGVGLHGKLIRTVINSTFVFVSGIDSGSIMNRFNQDLSLVDFKLPLDLFNTLSTACIVTVQLVLIAIGTIHSLAAIPAIFAVIWAVQNFYLQTSKRLRQLDLETKSALHTKVSESYQGIVTIRAHGWQRRVIEEFWEALDRSQEPQYVLWMVQTWLAFVLSMIVAGLAVIVAGIAIALPSKTSAGALGVAFVNMTTLGEYLSHTVLSWVSLETSLGAIARIEAFEKDTPVEREIEEPVEVDEEWPKRGEVEIDHLWARYGSEAEGEKTSWSLEDVTLKVEAGERVAVCGRSGSGKSTMLMALLGLVETPRGEIYLDGVDILRVKRELLREKYFVISQEGFLLGETIREALDADGKHIDDEEAVIEVLRECGILEKVAECGGLDGAMDKASFSVGERQLLGVARAVLHAAGREGGVVLFDEATSSIDTTTEERIMKLIREKLAGKTIISVLHRLEAALEYDRILVLENGRVAHFGTPEEVVREAELFSGFRR